MPADFEPTAAVHGASSPAPHRREEEVGGAIHGTLHQHRNALRACARRLLGSDAEAERLADEVLAAAAGALALFRQTTSVGSWLQGVAVGVALERLRAASQDDQDARDEEAEAGVDHLALPADPRLAELAATLPPSVRAVFVLGDLEALPVEDAAALLGIAATTARARLHRARATLLAALAAA
jgi:RNA polymerase sigma-70 factor (ECF subfamily)